MRRSALRWRDMLSLAHPLPSLHPSIPSQALPHLHRPSSSRKIYHHPCYATLELSRLRHPITGVDPAPWSPSPSRDPTSRHHLPLPPARPFRRVHPPLASDLDRQRSVFPPLPQTVPSFRRTRIQGQADRNRGVKVGASHSRLSLPSPCSLEQRGDGVGKALRTARRTSSPPTRAGRCQVQLYLAGGERVPSHHSPFLISQLVKTNTDRPTPLLSYRPARSGLLGGGERRSAWHQKR